MGSNPRAHLAYGYDLGSANHFKAAERGEFGWPELTWFGDGGDYEFTELAEKELRAAEVTGVEIELSGSEGSVGWVLVATGSERNVEWDETMPLDLDELKHEDRLPQWSKSLADALTALGITPDQKTAKWLVFPSYG